MFNRQKLFLGTLYGMAGGLGFAITAWGIDAYQLMQAHWAYPFASFIPGALFGIILGGLVGWSMMRLNNTLLSAALWLGFGIVLGCAPLFLPWLITPKILELLEPALQNWVPMAVKENYQKMLLVSILITVIPAILAGVVGNLLVEQANASSAQGSIVFPMLVCAIILALPGFANDDMLNAKVRNSAIVLDNTLRFVITHQGQDIDKTTYRQMHVGAIKPIEALLQSEYRLFHFSSDKTLEQVELLVKFDNRWAKCMLISKSLSYCRETQIP
jgi:hypothetical protein